MARPQQIHLTDACSARSRRYALAAGAAPVAVEDGAGTAEQVLLVPADRVSIFAVELPEMNPRRQAEALRWALEERIAGDPEAQHVVALGRRSDGRLDCAVVARADMQRWIDAAAARPDRLIPDAACLPRIERALVLMPFGESVLVGAGPLEFDRIEPELLEDLVPAWLERHPEIEQLVWLGSEPPSELAGRPVQSRAAPAEPLDLLVVGAQAVAPNLLPNLATGEFGPPSADDAGRWLRRAAVLAGLAVVLLLGYATTERWLLERARDQAAGQIEQRFAALFPEVTTLQRPLAQAERALAELGGAGADRFVGLMRRFVPLLVGASGVSVESLRYQNARLELVLSLPGMGDLEALQRQLRAARLDAEVGEVTVQGERTRARLEIRGGGA
ncbi:MAG: hypothetical protein GW900_02755 [Gammaproteobacteria bacterium]|nr:hypothetical protein [Gammaproteobacteria bacterium]